MTGRRKQLSTTAPAAWAQIEIGYRDVTIFADAFNAENIETAIQQLEAMLTTLKINRAFAARLTRERLKL